MNLALFRAQFVRNRIYYILSSAHGNSVNFAPTFGSENINMFKIRPSDLSWGDWYAFVYHNYTPDLIFYIMWSSINMWLTNPITFYLTSIMIFLSTASAHTFTNGRTSYGHQTDYHQERTEERGDVCRWSQTLYLILFIYLFFKMYLYIICIYVI